MEQLLINQQRGNLYNIVKAVRKLSGQELDTLFLQMKKLRVKNYPIVNLQESELLQTINKGLSLKNQKLYNVLFKKRCAEILTEQEHTEFLKLTEKKEALQEKRLENMLKLAKIRGITLSKLAKQLEIRTDLYVV